MREHLPSSGEGNPPASCSWLDTEVSFYRKVKATGPGKAVTVRYVLEQIRYDRDIAQKITDAREILETSGKEHYQKWRAQNLPTFAMSGTGVRGRPSSLSKHSGLLQIDIDADDNPGIEIGAMRTQLASDPHIAFIFTSPSGIGLKAGMRIDGDRHQDSFKAAVDYIKHQYGIKIDQAVSDPMRLCYLSADPDLILNPLAMILPIQGFSSVSPPPPAPLLHRNTEDIEDVGKQTNTYDGGKEAPCPISNLFRSAEKWACKESNTANKRAFELAREIKAYEQVHGVISPVDLEAIFDHWYQLSQPHLDPQKDRDGYYTRFIDKIGRVRIPAGGGGGALERAMKRASELPLPELPGVPVTWLKIAALNRELQREAGDSPYFLSCRAAQEFAGFKHHTDANRIQRCLATPRFNVLQIIKRGSQGEHGTATQWRYLPQIPSLPNGD